MHFFILSFFLAFLLTTVHSLLLSFVEDILSLLRVYLFVLYCIESVNHCNLTAVSSYMST